MPEQVSTLKEYWRWAESSWVAPDKDWTKARIITAGIDVGSVSSKAVIVADGELFAYATMRTGADSAESARKAMDTVLAAAKLDPQKVQFVVGTGYGRVNVTFAQKTLTEIACHARGANYIYGPTVRTILDMGGQDCKAIRCDEKGKVKAFLMNDKCAAGTGRSMEVFAELLEVPIGELGEMSLRVGEEPPPVSCTCVIFAKSEALGLLRKGWAKEKVLAAYCSAMAHRVVTLLQRVGIEKDFAVTGGIAKNPGVARRVERELGVTALTSSIDPQIAGGLGAALFAHALAEKASRS